MHAESAWLAVMNEAPAGAPHLFCFPHGGGNAAAFHPFRRLLAPAIDVVGIELPGRGSRFREPLDVSLAEIAAASARAIEGRVRQPFYLYGHSIGALLAFETARVLAARRCAPAGLFVSGRRAPQQPPVLPANREPISRLPDAALKQLLGRYAGTPAAILESEELLRLHLPVLRHDFALDENYRHVAAAPLQIPLWAYAGSDDPHASPQDMAGWSDVTAAACSVHVVPGGHFFPYEAAADFCRDLSARLHTHVRALAGRAHAMLVPH